MKSNKTTKTLIASITLFFLAFSACDNPLQEETFTTLGPTNFFNTAADAEIALNGVYGTMRYNPMVRNRMILNEGNTDIMFNRQGGIFRFTSPLETFTFDTDHGWLDNEWQTYYQAIFRANTVLDNVSDIDMPEERKSEILAEARFLRALHYYWLYDYFGPIPLILDTQTTPADRPTRPSEEEFITFLENEFLAVSIILPDDPPRGQYGRATRGAALGFLAKFHLMNHKWTEAADVAKQIIDSGVYELFTEGDRTELFEPDNSGMHGNREFMFVVVASENPTDGDNGYLAHAAPPGFTWKFGQARVNVAAQFRIRDEFLELFEPDDERLGAFLFEYIHADTGELIVLGEDDVRSFKYPETPNFVGQRDNNDWPHLRYADILLSRAEALNELNGPNQESVDLLNMIREAAGVTTFTIGEFSSQGEFRDFILDESGREFHTEGIRRQDLIRHGKFIEMARERGHSAASDHHVLYPIPQNEIDRNSSLTQNPGY